MERGDYYVQIVWDRNLGGRSIGSSAGNFVQYGSKIHITKDAKQFSNIVATKQLLHPLHLKQNL